MKRGRSTSKPTAEESAWIVAVKEGPCLVRVPALEFTYVDQYGSVYSVNPSNRWRGKLQKLMPSDNGRGYLRIRVEGKSRLVHGLVAEAYLGLKPEGLEVNHKDANKRNNTPTNLEYVSRSENMVHCFVVAGRLNKRGADHPMAKLSDEAIREMVGEYWSKSINGRMPMGEAAKLAEKYGVSRDYPRRTATGLGRGAGVGS